MPAYALDKMSIKELNDLDGRIKKAMVHARERELAAIKQKLDTLIVQAVFKQGEQKGAAGEHGDAARAYLRAAKEFPKDPRAAQSVTLIAPFFVSETVVVFADDLF